MRFLPLVLLLVSFAVKASPLWPVVGSTTLWNADPTTSLVATADGFAVGRPNTMLTGIVSILDPAQPSPVFDLQPAQIGQGAEFGYRVAASGGLMAVTEARRATQFPSSSGIVRTYEQTGGIWMQTGFLQPPAQPTMDLKYGEALAITPDHLFVAAPGFFVERGLVYVYARLAGGVPGWELEGSVVAYDGESFDRFGSSVAADGEWLVVGAPESERVNESEGAVYLFRQTNGIYVQVQQLSAPDPQSYAGFGSAIAIHGGKLVVGAAGEDDPIVGADAGAVYFYSLVTGQWMLDGRKVASDSSPSDSFGTSVSILGETACVRSAAAAYVFERIGSEFTETGKLAPVINTVAGSCAIGSSVIATVIFNFSTLRMNVRYYPESERMLASGFED